MPVPHFSIKPHALLRKLARCDKVALSKRYLSRKPERSGDTLFETNLSGGRETFIKQRGNSRLITLGYNEHMSQLGKSGCDPPLFLQLSVKRQALLEQGARPAIDPLAALQQPL